MSGRTGKWALAALLVMAVARPVSAQTAGAHQASVAATVNGETITLAQLEAVLKLSGPEPLPATEARRRQRQREALNRMIEVLLMHQFLEKNTPAVPPADVNKRLAELEVGLTAQKKTLDEYCRDTNQTLDQLKSAVADSIRWDRYARSKLDDATVEQYYKDYRDFFEDNQVRVSHIVLRVPASANQAERAQARKTLTDLRAQLLAKKIDFAEAARKYSQDPRAALGGDLDFIRRKWMFDEAFSRAAFSLPVGEVSDVVQTEYGLHLITVTQRKRGHLFDFAKNKEKVRELCTEDQREQLIAQQRKTGQIKITLP
jgi:peptidyl-prolyl cis-trans isomerase C